MKKPFRFTDKKAITEEVINSARKQRDNLNTADNEAMLAMAKDCIDEIETLHNTADITIDPPEDINIIWSISSPGWLTKEGSIPGWSANFPQLDGCEKQVIGKTINLAIAITAKRLGRGVDQITKEDILNHGPWIVYNVPPDKSQDLETYLQSLDIKIPREKVYVFDKKQDGHDISSTRDQVESIHMPPGVNPQKIAISVLAAQWVRLGRLLQAAKTLPQVPIILVPTASPKGFESEHAVMETRGAVTNAFQHHNANIQPIPYTLL